MPATTADAVLLIIAIAIAVNLVVMGGLLATLLLRRRAAAVQPHAIQEPAAYRLAGTGRYASLSPDANADIGDNPINPNPEDPDPTVTATDSADVRRFRPMMSDEGERADATIASFFSGAGGTGGFGGAAAGALAPATGGVPGGARDSLTGLDGPLNWEFRLRDENARLTRYRRPVSVVLVELDGLDRLIDRFGPEAAARLLPPVGETLHRLARLTDHVARIAEGRFAVLLPETDDIQAINYVERIRSECDRWLAAGAVAMRLAIGWASPAPGGDIRTAVELAEDRLDADRKRVGSAADVAAMAAARIPRRAADRPASRPDAAADGSI